jgi:hypothetical protein
MGSSLGFAIAGLGFAIGSSRRVRRPPGLGCYDEFDRSEGDVVTDTAINVDLVDSAAEQQELGAPLFDSGSWRAFRHGANRSIAYTNPDDESPTVVTIPDEVDKKLRVYQPSRRLSPDAPILTPFRYPLDQAIMMHLLLRFQGALVHGAGLVKNGVGVVCVGKSGAGKSTISRVAVEGGWRALSDDRIIIRRVGGEWRMFGTPWPGDCGYARNESARLTALCILSQDPESALAPLNAGHMFARLIPTVSLPMYDKDLVTQYFAILDRLLREVLFYDLQFTPDERVLPVLDSLVA